MAVASLTILCFVIIGYGFCLDAIIRAFTAAPPPAPAATPPTLATPWLIVVRCLLLFGTGLIILGIRICISISRTVGGFCGFGRFALCAALPANTFGPVFGGSQAGIGQNDNGQAKLFLECGDRSPLVVEDIQRHIAMHGDAQLVHLAL